MLPFVIVTDVWAVVPLLPVHPANVYPVFVGLLICTAVLYVPLVGAFVPAVPPLYVYPIVYVFAVLFADAVNVIAVLFGIAGHVNVPVGLFVIFAIISSI